MYKYDSKDPSSVFYTHEQEEHNGEKQNFDLKILSHHPGDAMLRQITEATHIRETSPDLNRKDEFGNRNVPRKRRTANVCLWS